MKGGQTGDRPARHVLSKSSFIRGCQCAKSLYLYKHHYNWRDPLSPAQAAIFRRGTNVGLLARELFPGGVDASPPTPFQYARSVARTVELIAEGVAVIYEAAFIHEGVLAAMDILVRDEAAADGGRRAYRAYEVKSSTGVSETYLLDAALQYWVISGSGVQVTDLSIVHIDSGYVRGKELELAKLFRVVAVKRDAEEKQAFVEGMVHELKRVVARRQTPDIEIGPQCHDPYPCDFIGTCWKDVPAYSVFDIARLSVDKKFDLYRKGIVELSEVPEDYPLSERQRLQVEVAQDGSARIDRAAIRNFLDSLAYPLYFLDFEAFQPAVPLYEGTRPYQQIPFQFSLHRLDAPVPAGEQVDQPPSRLHHEEFLAEAGPDPRRAFLDALLERVGESGAVLVYNQAFENGRLADLAAGLPGYLDRVEKVQERIRDLMVPFREQSYYVNEMRGSYSIKAVLPALVPDLSYSHLAIRDGTEASVAFESLFREENPLRRAQIRRRLLDYCALDTLAMVRILGVLEQVAAG